MSEEEKKAIAHLEWLLDDGILASEDEPYIETILNLIEKQNKIIDKMAEYIKEPYQLYLIKGRKTKMQAIIEYFRDKVEEDK